MDGHQLGHVLGQDSYVKDVLKNNPRALVGVFTLEEVNSLISNDLVPEDPIAIIVNTEEDPTKAGQHWVALYSDAQCPDGRLDYFDSLGSPPTKQAFFHFFNRLQRNWQYNKECLQHGLSSVCGYYCLYFLIRRLRGDTMKTISLQFEDDQLKNDNAVQKFIHKHYKVKKTDRFQHLKKVLRDSR